MEFDATGKVSLDHIYTEPDPRAYFGTLRRLDYRIPELAKPHFQEQLADYRARTGIRVPQVLDIGSSYGINAALLRCDLTMDDLYARYGDAAVRSDSTETLVARDRELAHANDVRFVGLDISKPALEYACAAGFLDDAVLADLENDEPTEHQRNQLAGTDVVISTGCLGYVGATTIGRVVRACRRRPWMAHFVLRMFPFDPIAETLADFGYDTVREKGLYRQRRFISAAEQSQVLETLTGVGVDPRGLETDGWFYAELYLSRPRR